MPTLTRNGETASEVEAVPIEALREFLTEAYEEPADISFAEGLPTEAKWSCLGQGESHHKQYKSRICRISRFGGLSLTNNAHGANRLGFDSALLLLTLVSGKPSVAGGR